MVYIPHEVVKAQPIVDAAAGMTAQNLIISKLFTRESTSKFAGREGDKIVMRVPGRLPYRRYAFRNNRANPIIFDVYKEGKSDVTMGDRIYSAVQLIDEQVDFDNINWSFLLPKQAEAVATGIEQEAAALLENVPWSVTIGGAEANLRSAVLEANKTLKQMRVNDTSKFLLVGADFEQALLEDDKIVFAAYSGDAVADRALTEASLGRIAGFQVVSSMEVPSDTAYAFTGSAFTMYTGAPVVPASVKNGGTTSYDGISLRWLTDYDPDYMTDRSLVDAYCGTGVARDRLLPASAYYTESPDPVALEPNTKDYFLRGLKLTLGGTSDVLDDEAFQLETGIKTPWVAPAKALVLTV